MKTWYARNIKTHQSEREVFAMDDTRLTLTVEEAAQMLGISRIKGYELAHSEGFPVIRIGRKLLIPRNRFLAWVDEQAGTTVNGRR